jgi:sugar phosphate isomerase/epimerase
MIYSRRDFGKFALASLPLSAAFANGKPDSKIDGVQLGAQSYSFRAMPGGLDDALKAMIDIGLSECELWQGHVEPKGRGKDAREELRKFRIDTPLEHFKEIADRFKTAGINLYAYNYSFRDDMTDEEISRGFEISKALGVKVITASATVSVTQRVAPQAEKYKMVVGMHGHDNLKDPNQFARPESFEKAMSESKWIGVNLDIGHFTAANFDAVAYIRENHERITHLHIKDRKKNDGTNEQFGDGDTPIKPVLSLLKEKKYPIRAFVEYEYLGIRTSPEEVKRCMDYMRAALA